MKIFNYKDIEIKYRVVGDAGPILLMLHGFGGGPNDWQSMTDQLSKSYRLVMPNLKSFFSHSSPLTFSKQVDILNQFVQELLIRKGVHAVDLLGQSYGATLSIGLRLTSELQVNKHILINPMPFHPLEHVVDKNVKILVGFGYVPQGISLYLNTERGRRSLEELAKIFRLGSLGQHEIKHMNDRKRLLVVKAFDRFRWIDSNENWHLWHDRLLKLPEESITHFIFSSHDSLYEANYYRKAAHKLKAREIHEIEHYGHLLAQDMGQKIPGLF